MLKDLDKRGPEQEKLGVSAIAPSQTSTFKIITISTLVLLSLNALGFYIWNLQDKSTENNLTSRLAIEEQSISQESLSDKVKPIVQLVAVEQKSITTSITEQESKLPLKTTSSTLTFVDSTPVQPLPVKSVDVVMREKEKNSIGKISISRRQLTPQELIEQKLVKAEKQLNANQISKAEKLFEEVLIIDSTHKQARKNLAALWFGRQSYQDAVNLLSQGIALDKQDSELRLMKARIHVKQGQNQAAYKTLKPLASIKQEEYQLMLANIAQKIQQYSSAIDAYQVLIEMQPYSGRWHLGLATIYDKNSQFSLAVNEYALALTKADLSASSAKFAQQRMQALGE
jgi:tetratricopeptide (TPR) repeat protein